ncbi:MAG TPA: Crp/Fnr family transcriptional regulator [Thermodesulfobacteriota bacterium]|nr:Crp/Fnr family transcriptional regulator [Thermodesulfobacteriota bacterium]
MQPALVSKRAEQRAHLRRVHLFADFDDAELDNVLSVMKERRYLRDATILIQRDPGDSCFLIVSGEVKVSLFGEDGKEITLAKLREGEVFGEMALLSGAPRSATVIALQDTTLLVLEREEFTRLVMRQPKLALKMLAVLAERLRKADEKIAAIALFDVSRRVTHFIIELAKNEGVQTPEGLLVRRRPTHREIANMTGTTRETVSRVLSELARGGYVSMTGKRLTVHEKLYAQAPLL